VINQKKIAASVEYSLQEDVGSGDITAALIAEETEADAEVWTRESAVICGIPWFNEVYRQIDPKVQLHWQVAEGDQVAASTCLLKLGGRARSLVIGERCALNWLQFLSGVATQVSICCEVLVGTKTKLLDTRKTLPGLRQAQKYAVRVGGGVNHRMGLYDAYLIKENHIASCGTIKAAVHRARELFPDKWIEVEVENLMELEEALASSVDRIMLDNFTLNQIQQAVALTQDRVEIEVSGNMNLERLREIAMTGVDYISMGSITKNVIAIDLSMRFVSSIG